MIRDLDLLARHFPILFGKALDPDGIAAALGYMPVSGRPGLDHASDHGLSRAIAALRQLQDLAAKSDDGRRAAAILLYSQGIAGPAARRSGAVALAVAQMYANTYKRLTPARLRSMCAKGEALILCAMAIASGREPEAGPAAVWAAAFAN